MLLMIDNYDSFTYNLVQYLLMLDLEVRVVRNDEVSVRECRDMKPEAVVVSPGPGTPRDAGISVDLIRNCSGELPVLGVCLGHQSIAAAFGGRIVPAARLMHGKVSTVQHDGDGLFEGIRSSFKATRYHSLAVERETLPDELQITGTADDGEIMALQHRGHPTFGVQFHPESIMTPVGKRLLENFSGITRRFHNGNH